MSIKNKIFDWNHISPNLSDNEIKEFKAYYCSYHRKCWAYKQALKRFKKCKLIGNSLSLIFASGRLASALASGGICLITITTLSLLIQGWMKHKNLDLKIQNCIYAYQSYQHLLNNIKEMMRTGDKSDSLYNTMTNIDDFITDNAPIIDKFLTKYDKIFN